MRDKQFSELQPRRGARRSHPPTPSSSQLSRPLLDLDGVAIEATPARLRAAFGRCDDAERAQLRDMRTEKNRLAAITRSDRAIRRHVIEMAKLERELEGVVFHLTVRVHDKRKAVPAKRRKRPDVAPVRRLPCMGITIVDRAGRRGILVEVTSIGAHQPRYRPGCCRQHLAYTWAENAVERLTSGALARCSNMGSTPAEVAAAMDLKEDVARASRANANLEIRIVIRMPDGISPEARLQILEEVCETFFGRNGLPYAAAVHPPDPHSDERNHHGHIQAGFRPMRHLGGSEWEVGTELRTDLSRPAGMRLLRAVIADTMTEVARKEGRQHTYTSLSYQERGLAMKPLKKVGREQTEAYRRGEYVGVVEKNKNIIAENLRRYAKQRMAWLKEAMAGLRRPDVSAPDVKPEQINVAALNPPRLVQESAIARATPGLAAPVIPVRIVRDEGRSAASLTRPKPGPSRRNGPSKADYLTLNLPTMTLPAIVVVAGASHAAKPIESPADVAPAPRSTVRPVVPKAALPVAVKPHTNASGIDEALLLLQLRVAQKKDRDALAERRRTLLDQRLFQRGDTREPTPEYAAFLLAIRDDPTRLRWQLDKGGKRRAPVVAGGDQAFRDRFGVYMQHPAVQRQVTALLERAYDPGTAWPDELAHGMWRYEPGQYGHRSAAKTRDGWAADDHRFRKALAPAGASPPILHRMGDFIVPDLPQVLRLSDADLVCLLHPSVQHDLIVRWREQQEERVECLAAIADGTARVSRRVVSIDGGAVRPKVTPDAVPPALAAAFARWQDDPDFYLDVALDSAATRAAARRKERCADRHLRALQASREAGDPPAVQHALAERVAAQDATAAGRAHRGSEPEISHPPRPSTAVRSSKTKRPRNPSPRRS